MPVQGDSQELGGDHFGLIETGLALDGDAQKMGPRWTPKLSLLADFRGVGMARVVMEVSFRTSRGAMASSPKPTTRVTERQLFFRVEAQKAQRRTQREQLAWIVMGSLLPETSRLR